MSSIANRRAFLSASNILAISMQPTEEMVMLACETLAGVLSDLSDEIVHIVPLSQEDVIALADYHAAKSAGDQEPKA